ncbi:hypothetical protein Nos7524_5605 (plasmid) [Nostoc sp. PCC 7524]|nr:hypothetical protein [Nostoc sp. PCC 7524]AFY51295.1 hypothetical protein Nos7524_5605 [Nostoc sp. PCC 7524]
MPAAGCAYAFSSKKLQIPSGAMPTAGYAYAFLEENLGVRAIANH